MGGCGQQMFNSTSIAKLMTGGISSDRYRGGV